MESIKPAITKKLNFKVGMINISYVFRDLQNIRVLAQKTKRKRFTQIIPQKFMRFLFDTLMEEMKPLVTEKFGFEF